MLPLRPTMTPRETHEDQASFALDWLKGHGSKAGIAAMARFAISADKAFGVSVGNIQVLAKRLGKGHELADALWKTGWYEARMLAAYVDEPARVSAAQMDRWCREFDNWGITDTVCFVLFDRTPHAWQKVERWSGRRDEFVKRAAFALLWGLTVHDKVSDDARFLSALELIERGATDERHFVKKAVNMALRAVGKRNRTLHASALAKAKLLSASPSAAASWVGRDAARELGSPAVLRRMAARWAG